MSFEPSWIHKFEVKKGAWVFVPSQKTRDEGLRIVQRIKKVWSPPDNFYHLRLGGHIQALKSHENDLFFASIDISDFFGSIGRSRITRALKTKLGYKDSREIALLSTVKHHTAKQHSHSLPFGYVQSPLIASLCLYESKLGAVLAEYHKHSAINVSIYMDDIVMSGSSYAEVFDCLTSLKNAAERSKFPLNAEKESGVSDCVIAFNIKLSHQNLEVTPKRFAKFMKAYIDSHSGFERKGILGYVGSVNSHQARKLERLTL
ncbi:hypothetical protein FM038_003310 [Shewanella eurypsychrophilus]|uniref:Reverse transcriptase domain-containing protein n=1 Tax=Shewanella eurypsychrophilus TaxID=2593656 RepID=A0ABX6V1R2_9GAMM|nr:MULTISPECIES: reverse transcriptase domain-containing protein [Shewanella]QFU21267.1 hypothetical protein FS418_04890 [Shewanella sp. YLB-09]QPG56558.1 hypothetical protein FM038_003310 [Shewanella eurypsychrophilus]